MGWASAQRRAAQRHRREVQRTKQMSGTPVQLYRPGADGRARCVRCGCLLGDPHRPDCG
jgi:hypothetical protein